MAKCREYSKATDSSMLDPFTNAKRKRSTKVRSQLITIDVNMKIIDRTQQQKLQTYVTHLACCCFL